MFISEDILRTSRKLAFFFLKSFIAQWRLDILSCSISDRMFKGEVLQLGRSRVNEFLEFKIGY